jgi:hypothetical protein
MIDAIGDEIMTRWLLGGEIPDWLWRLYAAAWRQYGV